jgi:hypothetical protein
MEFKYYVFLESMPFLCYGVSHQPPFVCHYVRASRVLLQQYHTAEISDNQKIVIG